MKLFPILILLVSATSLTAVASAQESSEQVAPTDSVTVEAVPPAPVRSEEPAAVIAGPVCFLGDQVSVDPGDAATIHALVCAELSAQGVEPLHVANTADGATEGYRVSLRRLGSLTLIEVTRESPIGSVQATRSLRLSNVEDAVVAAPRLASALVHNTDLEDTATVENLVHTEVRQPHQIDASLKVGLAVGGFYGAGSDATGYGAEFVLQHQTARLGIGARARIAEGDLGLAALTLGGRLYITESDAAPFIGAGLGLYHMWLDTIDDGTTYSYDGMSGTGLGLEFEAGVELMRFSNSRLGFLVRVDVPIFDLEGTTYDYVASTSETHNDYAVPTGLYAYYLFD